MKNFYRTLLAVALLCACSFAQTKNAATDSVASPAATGTVSEFEVNGLKVIVKQRPGSQTAVAGLFFRGGASNLTAENAGIEALTLEAATDASAKFPRAVLRQELARLASNISSGVNADYSAFTLGCERQSFDRSWDIFTDIILHPSFTASDITLEKERMVAGLRQRSDDPDSYLQSLQQASSFKGHPYLYDVDGTPENVTGFTEAGVRAYYKKLLVTSRMLLVFVGDFDAADLHKRVTAAFATLPTGDYVSKPVATLDYKKSSLSVTDKPLATNYVQGIYAGPQFRAPDYVALEAASNILRDRVYATVRLRYNLSYAPNAFLNANDATYGGIYVTAVDVDRSVSLMQAEIEKLKLEPVDQDTVTSVVTQNLTTYYVNNQTNAAQAGELAKFELIGGGWRNSETLIDRFKALTPLDIQNAARKYMNNLQYVVLGNQSQMHKETFVPTGQ